MVCQKCGQALPSEGFICKQCGTLMSEEQIIEQKKYLKENKSLYKTKLVSEAYGQQQLFKARETSSHKLIGLIFIFVILIIIIGIAIGVYLM